MPPIIDKERCNYCGICYEVCPQDVFHFERRYKARHQPPDVAYPDECWYCGACVVDCPKEAVALELPLHLHIVPSPAVYGPPVPGEEDALKKAAAFSRSVTDPRYVVDARPDEDLHPGEDPHPKEDPHPEGTRNSRRTNRERP